MVRTRTIAYLAYLAIMISIFIILPALGIFNGNGLIFFPFIFFFPLFGMGRRRTGSQSRNPPPASPQATSDQSQPETQNSFGTMDTSSYGMVRPQSESRYTLIGLAVFGIFTVFMVLLILIRYGVV